MDQVAYVLSRFGLEYSLGNPTLTVPTTMNFAEVEAATIAYIEEYLELTYNADATIFYDSVEIEATSRRTGGRQATPFIDYEASVAFAEDSPMTPTPLEIGETIAEAFQEPNFSAYVLNLASRLSPSNPFVSTTKIIVYVPDATFNDGRVARDPTRMSAAGIAAAAGTGVLTLLVGAFLLYKIRSENLDLKGAGKGYAGGLTLAGDTFDNSTLDASATLPNEDAQSLDSSLYNEVPSLLSDIPAGAVLGVGDARQPRIRTFDDEQGVTRSKIVGLDKAPHDDDSDEDEDDDDEDAGNEVGDSFQDEEQEGSTGFATLVGRTRALVPTFKSSPMSNTDIKNYFKTKYHCKSPKGYEAVEAANGGVQPCASDDQSLNLVLPALDHNTSSEANNENVSTKKDYESAYMEAYDDDESVDSTIPSDEGIRGDDGFSVGGSLTPSSAHRLVAGAQSSNQTSPGTDPSVVPKLPNEQSETDGGESDSVVRQMDEISLGPM